MQWVIWRKLYSHCFFIWKMVSKRSTLALRWNNVREPWTETFCPDQGWKQPLAQVVSHGKVPIRNKEMTSCCQPKEFGRGRKDGEMPAPNMSCQPTRDPEAKTHLFWDVCTIKDKQDDWPETTWKANPIIIKPETVPYGRAVLVLLGSFSPGAPSQ